MATQKEVAGHLSLTPRRIRDLLKAGILPAGGVGTAYDLDACRVAYIQYLRAAAAGRVKQVLTDPEKLQAAAENGDYSAALEYEKYRKAKRENDIEEGLVAPVALITDALQRAGAIIIANLETLPLLIKRHWPEITGDQITMVKRSIAECRNAIADMRIDMNG